MASGLPQDQPLDEQRLMRRRLTVDPEIAESWFFDRDGVVHGPMSGLELLHHVRNGEVTAETPVRKGDSQWVKASEVSGLFEAAFRRAFTYRCPYCGSEVDKPPTVCLGCDREITAVYRVREGPTAPPPQHSSEARNATRSQEKQAAGVPASSDQRTVLHSIVRWVRGWFGNS